LTQGRIAAAHGRFSGIRQSASSSNTWFLRPTGVCVPNGILIGSAVYAQLTAGSTYSVEWSAIFSL